MSERIKELMVLSDQMTLTDTARTNIQLDSAEFYYLKFKKYAELILENADELKRELNTDPINKPFQLDPKFVAKCDQLGRSRRQFQ